MNYTDVCVKVSASNYFDEFEDLKMFLLGLQTLVEAYFVCTFSTSANARCVTVSQSRVYIATFQASNLRE